MCIKTAILNVSSVSIHIGSSVLLQADVLHCAVRIQHNPISDYFCGFLPLLDSQCGETGIVGSERDMTCNKVPPVGFVLKGQEVSMMEQVMCSTLTAVSDQQWIALKLFNHSDPSLTWIFSDLNNAAMCRYCRIIHNQTAKIISKRQRNPVFCKILLCQNYVWQPRFDLLSAQLSAWLLRWWFQQISSSLSFVISIARIQEAKSHSLLPSGRVLTGRRHTAVHLMCIIIHNNVDRLLERIVAWETN